MLFQNALEYSPRLKSAAADVEAAKGAENQAGYLPNPEIGFEAANVVGSGDFGVERIRLNLPTA